MDVHLNLSTVPQLTLCAVGNFGGRGRQTFVLPSLWAVHIYFYQARLRLGETWWTVYPGTLSVTPAGVEAEYEFPDVASHIAFHLRLADGPRTHLLPLIWHLDSRMDAIQRRFEYVLPLFHCDRLAASVHAWSLLLDLVRWYQPSDKKARRHPALERVMAMIGSGCEKTLTLPALAAAADVSEVHLNRLFRAEFGTTVMAYVRRQRLHHAHHLLVESTLPIKAIAAMVGVYDTHAFNKLIRREFGISPRALRATHAGR